MTSRIDVTFNTSPPSDQTTHFRPLLETPSQKPLHPSLKSNTPHQEEENLLSYLPRMFDPEITHFRKTSPCTYDYLRFRPYCLCFQLFDPHVHQMLQPGLCLQGVRPNATARLGFLEFNDFLLHQLWVDGYCTFNV